MAKSEAWLCSSCVYWQPYPGWEGVGTCDNTLSRYYSRMAFGNAVPCEYAVRGPAPDAGSGGAEPTRDRSREPRVGGTTCALCHYWLPLSLMPQLGECDNPSSRHFRRPEFSDKPTEECFVERSLEGLEFMWCQSHRQTIYYGELADHGGCLVYVNAAGLPVEDEAELTLAGD